MTGTYLRIQNIPITIIICMQSGSLYMFDNNVISQKKISVYIICVNTFYYYFLFLLFIHFLLFHNIIYEL